MFGVIVKSWLAEPNGGTANHHEKRASRSELFCRRHFGASGLGKAESGQVRRPCTATRANEGRVDRYYDPTTSQFISVDPDVAETGQPYAFTGDDPVNGTDPLGLYVSGGGSSECNTSSDGTLACTGSLSNGQSVAGTDNRSTGATTGGFITNASPPQCGSSHGPSANNNP
jgi:RHS repeat-associated protein